MTRDWKTLLLSNHVPLPSLSAPPPAFFSPAPCPDRITVDLPSHYNDRCGCGLPAVSTKRTKLLRFRAVSARNVTLLSSITLQILDWQRE
ncbi:hypothetical protein Baya_5035 [Bagarius yarrelli]|uniref:Uncharacterized protein n=1 Tax=Bagarius yarrelli TaxID=175774 RepID=A0A556TV53_BAGYA|nr:hypothetical protein Baya_5035 [Bagarius yarrelli]